MTLTQALGRIGELQSTIDRFSATAPPMQPAAQAGSTAPVSPSVSPMGAGPARGTNADFEALMRVLNYSNEPAAGAQNSSRSTSAERTESSTPGSSTAAASTSAAGGSSSIGAPTGTSGTGDDAVELAKTYLGVPYVWGGNDPNNGLDCSGLVKLVYEQLGVSLPRVAKDQATRGREIPSLDQAEPGDLIVTYEGGHIGIYVGDGKMIHAPRPGRSVSIDPVSHYTDPRGIMTIRRVLDAPSEAAVSQSASVDAAAQRRQFEVRAGADA